MGEWYQNGVIFGPSNLFWALAKELKNSGSINCVFFLSKSHD